MTKIVGELVLYSVDEIATALDVNRRTVLNYLNAGKLRGRKFGRSWFISEDALRAFFDASDAPETEPVLETN